jgi:hypothetical protein
MPFIIISIYFFKQYEILKYQLRENKNHERPNNCGNRNIVVEINTNKKYKMDEQNCLILCILGQMATNGPLDGG